MVAKAAGGILGIGLIGTGGIAMAKPHWLGMDYMPKWHSLSEDNDYTTKENSDYKDKFGKKYKSYLVGVTNKKSGDDSTSNRAWWEWAFRRLKGSEVKSGKFKVTGTGANNVEIAYDNSSPTPNSKALNQVCKSAYGTDDSSEFGTGDSQFSKNDVWKYCSPGKLTTTSEDTVAYGANKIGGGGDKTTLVSVKDSSNDWFWEIRNEDFWKEDNDWSGKKASEASGTDKSLFKTAYDNRNTSKPPIKELCRQAYEQPTSSSKDSDDAKKFCKLEGSTT